MNKRMLTIPCFYDDEAPETYYLLPSGDIGYMLLVNESPSDVSIRHISTDDELLEKLEN